MDKIWIPANVFQEMQELADLSCPNETGGMLLGYIAQPDIVVTKIIGPGPAAKHARFAFEPDSNYQQLELEQHFYATGGRETYLGDWHTHPYGSSQLSRRDKRTLALIAETPSSNIINPVMVVLAGKPTEWMLNAVRFVSTSRRLFIKEYQVETLSPLIY